MRILMIGAVSIQYIVENWVEPLKELAETHLVDVSLLVKAYGKDFCQQYIFNILRQNSYDYVFFYPESVNYDFSDTFFERLREYNIPVLTFYADDEPEIWFSLNEKYDHRFSLIATQSKKGLERRINAGYTGEIMFLPWGFNQRIFKPGGNTKKNYDVIYFGVNSASPENPNLYIRDGFIRQQVLVKVSEICRDIGCRFDLFGGWWDRHPTLHAYARGRRSTQEMVNIYHQAKIVVNPGFSADGKAGGYQTKLRHFEVAGAGAFQMTNYNPELAEIFKEDQEIVFFRDADELREKIAYYLKHDEKRLYIAQKACEAAHSKHTMSMRVKELLVKAATLWPPKNSLEKTACQVEQIVLERPSDLFYELKKLCQTQKKPDWVHFISNKKLVVNTQYDLLGLSRFQTGKPLIWGRTFLQTATLHDEPLIRYRQNISGVVLPEIVDASCYHPWVISYIRENLFTVDIGKGKMALLDNVFIPGCLLEKVYTALQDRKAVLNLPYYHSGVLTGDYKVVGDCPEEVKAPQFIAFLRQLFDNDRYVQEKFLLYGGRGLMAEDIFRLLKGYPEICFAGVVDAALAEPPLPNWQVFSYEDVGRLIEEEGVSTIIIAAAASGSDIYKNLEKFQPRARILPLYDLSHPVWQTALPITSMQSGG